MATGYAPSITKIYMEKTSLNLAVGEKWDFLSPKTLALGPDGKPDANQDVHRGKFYDRFFEWGKKEELTKLVAIRNKNGIGPASKVNILAAESDLYMAAIDDKIIMKIGPKTDLGNLLPSNYQVATSGIDQCWQNGLARPVRPGLIAEQVEAG
ncbi:hypothetical protein LWI28_007963 [Acer negundo]|uniref:alpha-amylase n=1 Tax=Acer negundo TaxID=4023 RepID=A0AAD5JIG0_ACENE|nr:hypothetical protein LWI28_007963 [Acer negundo]